jgi:hypothetical protein
MILIAVHKRGCEQEHKQEVLLNVSNEKPGHDAPDSYSAKRESEARNRGECEDRGTTPERPSEAHPERTSDDDHVDEGFGPLKTVLEATSAVYSNYEVC